MEGVEKKWGGNEGVDSACPVSVVCTTYNHEDYIRQALDSFLSQNTEFQFEIVIHDDASTDQTRSIIEQYVAAHPMVIRPVFQTINQYSQGGFKPMIHASQYAAGRYLALCEGDDYWVCDNKLQAQYDSMQADSSLDFCIHSAFQLKGGTLDSSPTWCYPGRRVLDVKDILESPVGTFAPTSSYMIRREVLDLLPDWFFKRAPVGDFFIEMYAAKRGGALYLDSPMSVYRTVSEGSWHLNTYGNDKAFEMYLNSMLESVNLLESDFPGMENSFIWKRAWLYTFGAFHYLRREKYSEFRELIEKALAERTFISNKQAVAYILRRWPRLANELIAVLFHIKRAITGSAAK